MPYKLVRDGAGYYVVSPHGHYLSKHPLSMEQATRQKTAVTLIETRREHKTAERIPMHHMDESHVHKIDEKDHDGREELAGSTFVPVSRDRVHIHGVIPTRDVFAPMPMPAHELRSKAMMYSSHG